MKKVLYLLLAVAILFAFTSCKGSVVSPTVTTPSTQQSAETTAPAVTSTPEPTVELSYMLPMKEIIEDSKAASSWFAIHELENRLNIRFRFIQVFNGEYNDKLSVTLAGGDLPDLLVMRSMEDVKKYGDEGAFINYLDYSDSMPSFTAYYEKYEPSMIKLLSLNGSFYGAPQIYDFPYVGIGWMVRDDIITELGYDRYQIKTLEQFTQVLYAMKESYPDTTPYIGRWGMDWAIHGLMVDAGTATAIYYDLNDQCYKFGPFTDELKTVVEWYAQLVQDGIFEVNFNLTSTEWQERLTTGQAFVVWDYVNQNDTLNLVGRTDEADFDMRGMGGLRVNGKEPGKISQLDVSGNPLCIPTTCSNIGKALQFVDYIYSEEVITLMNWGIEGTMYQLDSEGNKVFTSFVKTLNNPEGQYDFATEVCIGCNSWPTVCRVFTLDAFGAMELNESGYEAMQLTALQGVSSTEYPAVVFTEEEQESQANIMTPVYTYMNENIAKFITGDRNISEWDQFVQDLRDMNVQGVIDQYNSKLTQ